MKSTLFSLLTIIASLGLAQNTVSVGSQTWMSKNLESPQFQNGGAIRQVQDREEWVRVTESGQPAWAYYYDEALGKQYGYMYNIHSITKGNPCPKGFRVPTNQDWEKLFNFLGASAGLAMKSSTGWETYNGKGNGTNSSGFNALPGGIRSGSGGFNDYTKATYFWSNTSHPDQGLWSVMLMWHMENAKLNPSGFKGALHCRCIKE